MTSEMLGPLTCIGNHWPSFDSNLVDVHAGGRDHAASLAREDGGSPTGIRDFLV